MKSTGLLLLLGVCLSVSSVHAQSIIYVDGLAIGTNDGTSWSDAFSTVYEALEEANNGDTIMIAEGVYHPDIDGSDSRSSVFAVENAVVIMGGYESGGGHWDPEVHQTIWSGDIGIENDMSDNCYQVAKLECPVAAGNIELIGIKVKHGHANGGGRDSEGAALRVESDVILRFMEITANHTDDGCALRFGDAVNHLEIYNTRIHGNTSSTDDSFRHHVGIEVTVDDESLID